MRAPRPTITVPPVARARALGALVPRGQHAVAYAAEEAEGLLAGFALEGLDRGEQVVVLSGAASPRAMTARLRAQGVAPPAAKPAALRVLDPAKVAVPLSQFLLREALRGQRAGYDGLRVAHVPSATRLLGALNHEPSLPRRFSLPVTLLCVYTPENLQRTEHNTAWDAARYHERILYV